eukprot:1472396-Prorocentrum_lima.AAC.1
MNTSTMRIEEHVDEDEDLEPHIDIKGNNAQPNAENDGDYDESGFPDGDDHCEADTLDFEM